MALPWTPPGHKWEEKSLQENAEEARVRGAVEQRFGQGTRPPFEDCGFSFGDLGSCIVQCL